MNLPDINIEEYDTLFLDRDGVINVLRPNDYVKCWEEFEFIPDMLNILAEWAGHFKYIIVVTNQRGVGRGRMTEESLLNIHHKMCETIAAHGGRIDKVYYNTAISDEDPDRKPNIGMAIQAKKDFPDINFSKALMIGDSDSDMIFAKNARMKGIKINR